jgi:hypothetical protein
MAKRRRRTIVLPRIEYPFLRTAYLRVERAREHLEDIKQRSAAYWDSTEKHASFGLNVEAKKLYLRQPLNLRPLPAKVGLLAGEVIYNLRAALDYLVFELAILDTGSEQRGTQFPIEDSKDSWRTHVYPRNGRPSYLNGLTKKHIAAVKRCQPCRGLGGKRRFAWIARMRDISNADKHRQWTVVMGMVHGNVRWQSGPVGSFSEVASGKVYRAQKADGTDIDVHVDGNLIPFITLENGAPIIQTLQQFIARVTDILDAFKPEFKGRKAPGYRTAPVT